jgi:hypothetical protein
LTVIAIAGPNLPHEVLEAAGCHGGVLALDPDRATPTATRWLESKFAPWAFPLVEAWAAGEYDHFDAVLFSRADDTSQRLYYYLCELQRRGDVAGPEPLVFDLAKISRPSSVEHTVNKVRQLAHDLGVDQAALEQAIVTANQRRSAATAVAAAGAGPLCLIEGSPLPDQRLHRVIAASGFAARGQTLAERWSDPGGVVAEASGDPAAALGAMLHAMPDGGRSFADPVARLRSRIAACSPAAVIVWRIEEDEAQSWQLPAERRVLAEVGVPSLVLTRTDWLARDDAADQITAFLAGVAG